MVRWTAMEFIVVGLDAMPQRGWTPCHSRGSRSAAAGSPTLPSNQAHSLSLRAAEVMAFSGAAPEIVNGR